jgi:hypothetical protein
LLEQGGMGMDGIRHGLGFLTRPFGAFVPWLRCPAPKLKSDHA